MVQEVLGLFPEGGSYNLKERVWSLIIKFYCIFINKFFFQEGPVFITPHPSYPPCVHQSFEFQPAVLRWLSYQWEPQARCPRCRASSGLKDFGTRQLRERIESWPALKCSRTVSSFLQSRQLCPEEEMFLLLLTIIIIKSVLSLICSRKFLFIRNQMFKWMEPNKNALINFAANFVSDK